MIQFSYTSNKPVQFFVVTFVNDNNILEKQTVNESRRKKVTQNQKRITR